MLHDGKVAGYLTADRLHLDSDEIWAGVRAARLPRARCQDSLERRYVEDLRESGEIEA